MQNNDEFKLTELELDALKEVANIGVGNASIALSSIFRKKVNISLPDIKIETRSQISKYISGPSEMVVGFYSNIKEGLKGELIMTIPLTSAVNIANFFLEDRNKNSPNLSEHDEVILQKVGSAIYASYLTSLAKFFQTKILFEPPYILCTMRDSMIDYTLLRMGNKTNILIIKLEFNILETEISGDFSLMFSVDASVPLISAIRNKISKDHLDSSSDILHN